MNEHFRPSAAGLNVSTTATDEEGHSLVVTRNGEAYPVTQLGGYYVGVNAWNSRGQMVGYESIGPERLGRPKWRPILIENGISRDIGIRGFEYLSANAINEKGQVVGGTEGGFDNTPGAFFFDGQTTKLIGSRYSESNARDINESSVIVGEKEGRGSSALTSGFVYVDGSMYDLNSITDGRQGLHIYRANAIRDDNWIWASAVNLETGRSSQYWLKPEFVLQVISDDASTPDAPSGGSGPGTDDGQIPMPGDSEAEPSSETEAPPVTVVDTETGDWNKPTIDPESGEAGFSGTPGMSPDPVPVPEPVTCLIWGAAAAILGARGYLGQREIVT